MATKKDLIKAATEMNNVMGLQPPIKVDGTEEELKAGIQEAITFIDPVADHFTKPTQAIIDEFTSKDEDDDDDEEPENAPQEDEDADVPTAKAEPVKSPLATQVSAAKKTSDLLAILTGNKEFKTVQKELAEIKNPIILKKRMMNFLTTGKNAPVEKPQESTAKAPKAAAVPKAKPAKTTTKVVGYSRIDSVCDVLKEGAPATVKELVELSDAKYASKTGKPSNLQEAKTVTGFVVKICHNMDIVCPEK